MTTTTRRLTRPAAPRAQTAAAPLAADWRSRAACRAADPEQFFPQGRPSTVVPLEDAAKRICGHCTVREACLEWALETGQHAGVWGGLSEDERRGMSPVREPSMTRCLNRQQWIEDQMAAEVSQKQIARELGVDTGVLSRAVQRFQAEREQGVALEAVNAA